MLIPFPKMMETRNAVLMLRYLSSCASISASKTPINAGKPITTKSPTRRK